MLIQVTQEDIKNGKRCHGCYCPVALAVTRVVPQADKVIRVETTGLQLTPHAKWLQLPESARTFIRDFDTKQPVAPFEFELPSEAVLA
jgi:hypothetical protein